MDLSDMTASCHTRRRASFDSSVLTSAEFAKQPLQTEAGAMCVTWVHMDLTRSIYTRYNMNQSSWHTQLVELS